MDTVNDDQEDVRSTMDETSILFKAVSGGFASLSSLVDDWMMDYKENRSLAIQELLQFIFRVCGRLCCMLNSSQVNYLDEYRLVDVVVSLRILMLKIPMPYKKNWLVYKTPSQYVCTILHTSAMTK